MSGHSAIINTRKIVDCNTLHTSAHAYNAYTHMHANTKLALSMRSEAFGLGQLMSLA